MRTLIAFAGVWFVTAAMAADFTGTWKVDPAKSKPGGDSIRTIKIEQNGRSNTFHLTFDFGNRQEEVTETCDGREHPRVFKGVNTAGYTDICRQISPITLTVTTQKDGKTIAENTFTLSSGGDVLTHTRTGQEAHIWIAAKE